MPSDESIMSMMGAPLHPINVMEKVVPNKFEIKIKIKPYPDFSSGVLRIETETKFPSDEVASKISREIFNAKDKMVRSFLIGLGWTPPPEPPPSESTQSQPH